MISIHPYLDEINSKKRPDYNDNRWSMVEDGQPVEVEVGEFLYSLVRVVKPIKILESGTNIGYSTVSMAQSLVDNNENGIIDTIDTIDYRIKVLTHGFNNINKHIMPSLDFDPKYRYDMIFLDSNRSVLHDEFIKFWPFLNNNGILLIHDTKTQEEKKIVIEEIKRNYNISSYRLDTARGIDIFKKKKIEIKSLNSFKVL